VNPEDTMRRLIALSAIAFAACGDEHTHENIDVEGCEHLEEGPYSQITAGTARDGTAPAVATDHMAYTTTLPASAVGYVSFAAAEMTDYIVFLDRNVTFTVFDTAGAPVTIEASETSSTACTTIMGKHLFELEVGTAYFGLGPDTGGPVNVVVEEFAHMH
jgi:hypothetical protein